MVAAHTKLVTLVTGVAVTLAIGTVIGMMDVEQAHAMIGQQTLIGPP